MAKSPAFQFYPKDFLVDTVLLTAEEVGAYWLLCSQAWVGLRGCEQGYLPNNDKKLAVVCRISVTRWKSIKGTVLAFFELEDDLIYHGRLLRELNRQQARSRKAAESAACRWNESASENGCEPDANADANALRSVCSSSSSASASAKKSKSVPPSDFAEFWLAYPKKRGKQAALKAWKQTSSTRPPLPDLLSHLDVLAGSKEWRDDAGKYIPHPSSWLNAGGWDDEVAVAVKEAPYNPHVVL